MIANGYQKELIRSFFIIRALCLRDLHARNNLARGLHESYTRVTRERRADKMASGSSSSLPSQTNPTTTTTTTTTTTLGGIQTGNGSEKKNVKDVPLPDTLNILVNQLRDYIKKQKGIKDEIERHSIKSFKKVSDENSKLRKDVSLVLSGIQKDASAVENLKVELSQELINAEIAQQTSNTPLAFQHENTAPREYFQKLVESFEERMHLYRRQVEEVESHFASLQQPQTVSPQEISDVMKKLHETFITLAARMHEIHELVKLEKERYIDYREKAFGDRTNIFQRMTAAQQRSYTVLDMPGTTIGPSPFTSHNHTTNPYRSSSTSAQGFGVTRPSTGISNSFTSGLGNTSTLTGQTSGTNLFGSSGFGSTGFGASNTFGLSGASLSTSALGKSIGSSGLGGLGSSTSLNGSATSLQLQRPPLGTKRGKK